MFNSTNPIIFIGKGSFHFIKPSKLLVGLIGCLFIMFSGNAQENPKISGSFSQSPLIEVILDIESKTNYRFYFIEDCKTECLSKYFFTYLFATSFYELIVKTLMEKVKVWTSK